MHFNTPNERKTERQHRRHDHKVRRLDEQLLNLTDDELDLLLVVVHKLLDHPALTITIGPEPENILVTP